VKVRSFCPLFVSAFLLPFLLSGSLQGQTQSSPQILHGHLRNAVSSGQAVPVTTLPPAQRLNLSIVLPLRNQPALTSLLSRLYDPSSPDYRQFLTVAQFTEQFAPSPEDYKAVVAFARANGFTVTSTPVNRRVVPISGTVTQVEKAFHINMKFYRHPTENRLFFSPDREPSLDLSVPVAHIAGLNNFSIPQPMVKQSSSLQNPAPAAVSGSGPGGTYLASDMRAAYYGGTALTGAGQTVALVEFDGYNLSDVVASFDGTATASTNGSNYTVNYTPVAGGTAYTVPVDNVLLDGATGSACQLIKNNCADAEQALDIVQAIGMAPGLSQVRVYIGDTDADILNAIAAENIASQLSISWTWSPDDPVVDDEFFLEFAAQGQSAFAASGDYGAFSPSEALYYPAEDA